MMEKNIAHELKASSENFVKTLSSFSDHQFNEVPFEGSWTAGQIGEHILKSNVTPLLYGKTEETSGRPDEKVQRIKDDMLNFEVKMKNPDFNTPSESKKDKEKTISKLRDAFEKAVEAAGELDLTKTCNDFELPGGAGKLTRLEWLYFMNYHIQRHTHQLENVKEKVN